MKKELIQKQIQKNIKEMNRLRKMLMMRKKPSTYWIPIYIDNKERGTLKMTYDYELDINDELVSSATIREDRFFSALSNLDLFIRFFDKIMTFDLQLNERHIDDINQSAFIISSLLLFTPDAGLKLFESSPRTLLGEIIYSKDDGLFELIKSEGPMVLCNPDAQELIIEWLSDKNNANSKMVNLKDALLKFSFGTLDLKSHSKKRANKNKFIR